MDTYVKRFEEIGAYSDPSWHDLRTKDILPEGLMPGISIGYNYMDGPGHVGRNSHTWDQIFVIVQGQGRLELGNEVFSLEANMIALIPAGTEHDTFVEGGKHLEYFYINHAKHT